MRPKLTLQENANHINSRYVQNYPGEMQTNWLILVKNPQTNENKSAVFSVQCVQN
jgi:hypothetical protein